jgi:hypothetical protein
LLPRFKPTPKIKQIFKANLQLIDCTKRWEHLDWEQ